MASALNKRQQARNERTLQELIKTVPGNGVCADCGVRNPGWASWSLGIFLCMRCGALHRKLGTHISKVKSLSMDKWDNAQVDNMKRIGNTESNKTYNPRNIKAQMPIDIDEVESAMERFIRQKYEQRAFMNDSRPGTRSNTGSSSSVEDRPPPLPPKPTKRFGFGIQKSVPLPPRNGTPPVSPGIGSFSEHGNSPPRVNKASRVFGSSVVQSSDGLDSKLATLKDMGFPDDRRNATVLKGLNGNLDKAVEALIRLGEQNPGKSRGNTPTPPAKLDMNGLMLKKAQTMPAPAASTNPFDALDAAAPLPPLPPQSQHYGGSVTQPTSPSGSYNPFLQQMQASQHQQHPFAQQQQQQQFATQTNPFGQPQQQQTLEQTFQGLGLSSQQTQQPLFPNRTGDYNQQPPFAQTNPFQQSFTPPPMPQMPPQYGSFYQSQPQQQQYQPMSSPTSPGNPFLKSARSQMFSPSNTSSNPFGQFTNQQVPQQQQQQPQQQQQQQSQQYPQQNQQQPQQHSSNPFMMQQHTQNQPNQAPDFFQSQQPTYQQLQQQQSAYQQPQQQQQQPTYQQPQGAFNKNSIMALYDYPQPAPQQQEQIQSPPAAAPAPATVPVGSASGQMNPFASAQAPQQPPSAVPPQLQDNRHVSRESVHFAGLMGGRHSPDAFSGLSSSFRRP